MEKGNKSRSKTDLVGNDGKLEYYYYQAVRRFVKFWK